MFDPLGVESMELNHYLLADHRGNPICVFSVPTGEVDGEKLHEAVEVANGEGSKVLWLVDVAACGSLGDMKRRIKERDYSP